MDTTEKAALRADIVARLRELQAYGAERAAILGITDADIPALVERAIAEASPELKAQAHAMVQGLLKDVPYINESDYVPTEEDLKLQRVFREVLSEQRALRTPSPPASL
jgi:hypothetical protein